MTFQISRDAQGKVLITDLATGKSEAVSTKTTDRPAQTTLEAATDDLPSFMWDRRST